MRASDASRSAARTRKRRHCLVLAWITFCVAYVASTPSTEGIEAAISYSSGRAIDLGPLPAGTHRVDFTLQNMSGETVSIEDVRGSCGCAKIAIPLGDLARGEVTPCSIDLTVRPGVRKRVFVFVEYGSPLNGVDTLALSFHGEAIGRLTPNCGRLDMIDLPAGTSVGRRISFNWGGMAGRARDTKWRVRVRPARQIEVTSQELLFDGSDARFLIGLELTFPQPGMAIAGWVELEVGEPLLARAVIPVTFSPSGDLKVTPLTLTPERVPPSGGVLAHALGLFHCTCKGGWKLARVVHGGQLKHEIKEMKDAASVRMCWTGSTKLPFEVHRVLFRFTHESGETAEIQAKIAIEYGE